MLSRVHWSYSSLNQFLRCPLQFFFQRIRGLPQPTVGSGLVLGSSVHRTLELYHRSLQARKPVKIDQLHRTFLEAWKERESKSEIAFRKGDTRDGGIAQGIGLIEVYLKEPPPENIVAVGVGEQDNCGVIGGFRSTYSRFLENPHRIACSKTNM